MSDLFADDPARPATLSPGPSTGPWHDAGNSIDLRRPTAVISRSGAVTYAAALARGARARGAHLAILDPIGRPEWATWQRDDPYAMTTVTHRRDDLRSETGYLFHLVGHREAKQRTAPYVPLLILVNDPAMIPDDGGGLFGGLLSDVMQLGHLVNVGLLSVFPSWDTEPTEDYEQAVIGTVHDAEWRALTGRPAGDPARPTHSGAWTLHTPEHTTRLS